MNVYGLLDAKRAGESLDRRRIEELVDGFLRGEIADYQMSAFLMAAAIRGLSREETVSLTRAMIASGRTLRFDGLKAPVVDKHSTGGVGDLVSLVLLPVAVECGLRVPMISGRSLGFTGGTLDKLESIPGFRTGLAVEEIERQVRELGGCFAAQTEDLVPADRRLYALRDATATVESIPLITASILSKKLAEGIEGVVIDVKCGRGAFMRTIEGARGLAASLEAVGGELGTSVVTVVTAMDEPLGAAAGNALEVEEAIRTLRGSGPDDIVRLTDRLVGEMLRLGRVVGTAAEGEERARQALESGRAMERFERIVAAQGGRLGREADRFGLPRAPVVRRLESPFDGFVASIDARAVGEIVRDLGGGRRRQKDRIDPSVGIRFLRKRGEAVSRGEALAEIHAAGEEAAETAARSLAGAFRPADEPPASAPLFL